ncbi:hypothetical protein R3O65_00185 [Corynebacterium pseudodiphtheriticum]|uniref:hypothetical protein n=1 Tax=Corynebacterium sp. MSK297 TaxID=3050221 RepID=UPI000403E252|nr:MULTISPECIES: hypothetical protein [Corynebacterium]RUP94368.1 hypothetical protein D8M19_04045 [Corynebacterium pseudodiphtheriticum]UNU75341.1 hypothetical protein HH207_05850 [Corynebacterium pseudodiphtheriticum]UNU77388.1 hypothetical protein HH208_06370 [Corynebacterium pseudodiphtheriticum]
MVAEQVGDHGAENNDGNGQNQRPPEAVPKHCGAVSGVFAVTMNVVVCFRSGVITMVIAGMVGSAHDVPFAQPGRGRDDG